VVVSEASKMGQPHNVSKEMRQTGLKKRLPEYRGKEKKWKT
jgi:hypothetical protein